MILDRPDELRALQERVRGTTIQAVLDETCAPALLADIDAFVRSCAEELQMYFPSILAPRIAKRLPYAGDPWEAIRGYCKRRLGNLYDMFAWYALLEVLIAIFQPVDAGAWIGSDSVGEREPALTYDKDGLLVDGAVGITFTKEGALTPRHWLFYDREMPGAWAQRAFVDELLTVRSAVNPRHFGMRVRRDAMLARDHHFSIATRAYIRGPIGLSEAMLDDPGFPQDKRGSVTEYMRVGTNPLYALFPLDRFEVTWSERRDDSKGEHVKTVQMEEVRPCRAGGELVLDRYVHSEWDCNTRSFAHLDGAIRGYASEQNETRHATDIKHAGKSAEVYEKLFRIDAALDPRTWSTLVAKFYEQNELTMEYLGGEDTSEEF